MNAEDIKQAASLMGRKGGSVCGPQKGRKLTPEEIAKMQSGRRHNKAHVALLAASKSAVAALTQNATFPADIALAVKNLSEAIALAEATTQKGEVKE